MSTSTSEPKNQDYQKLVDFMKRVTMNDLGHNESYEIGSKNQDFLIPKVPVAKETCTLELPDGKLVELPLLEGSEGPKSIDGRQFH